MTPTDTALHWDETDCTRLSMSEAGTGFRGWRRYRIEPAVEKVKAKRLDFIAFLV
jgi:hypothetical protein